MEKPPHPEAVTREAVFERLVQAHARMMYRVAYGLLRHAEDAEDAVQDAFLKLYRGEAWRAMQDEAAFLARTVWRTAYDRMTARVAVAEEDDAGLRLRDARPAADAVMEANEERALLDAWIDELPEDLRAPLLLSAVEELNSRQIAAALAIPEGTVRTRLMRARGELRRLYAAHTASHEKQDASSNTQHNAVHGNATPTTSRAAETAVLRDARRGPGENR
jgi:RNA polymerase sigma-70 factor (ECF subfamily)